MNATKNIRVGFILNYEFNKWLGGINYFKNLIDAILSLPERNIEPVIFTSRNRAAYLPAEFQNVEVVFSELIDRWTPYWILRSGIKVIFKYDFFLGRLLKAHQIDLLSHINLTDSHAKIPFVCWIPDFQHVRLKNFFSAKESAAILKRHSKLCKRAIGIILSSREARKDLMEIYSEAADKSFVLNFVVKVNNEYKNKPIETLKKKYHIAFPYFHVPNQFWAHKNHKLILDALHILKKEGKEICIIATGYTKDYRQPDYYSNLMNKAASYGVLEFFRVLGVIPYQDMMSIMWHSIAVINPSFFEGWSTTVEEAKSMGKKVILSDIPVHREQNPERCIYVDPENPEELAIALERTLSEYNPEMEKKYAADAKESMLVRMVEFGRGYQEIVQQIFE